MNVLVLQKNHYQRYFYLLILGIIHKRAKSGALKPEHFQFQNVMRVLLPPKWQVAQSRPVSAAEEGPPSNSSCVAAAHARSCRCQSGSRSLQPASESRRGLSPACSHLPKEQLAPPSD